VTVAKPLLSSFRPRLSQSSQVEALKKEKLSAVSDQEITFLNLERGVSSLRSLRLNGRSAWKITGQECYHHWRGRVSLFCSPFCHFEITNLLLRRALDRLVKDVYLIATRPCEDGRCRLGFVP
jgi:hypothetical protein